MSSAAARSLISWKLSRLPLSEPEKQAGKAFRENCQARLDTAHPASPCDPHIREYRHDCAARGGVSWPLRLKEHVEASPDGLFTFTWTDGHCRCGLAVRSSSGRFQVNG